MNIETTKRHTSRSRKLVRRTVACWTSLALAAALIPGTAIADTAYPDQDTPAVSPDQGNTTVDVGNVTVDVDTGGYNRAACAEATGGDATLNVHGDVTMTGDDSYADVATEAKAMNGNTGILNVEGNVKADVTNVNTTTVEPVEVNGLRARVEDLGSHVEANVQGDVSANVTSKDRQNAVSTGVFQYIHNDGEGDTAQSNVTVGGNVTAEAKGGDSEVGGVDVDVNNASESITNVKGGVSATGTYATGINVDINTAAKPPYNPATTAVIMVGDDGVTASGLKGATGITTVNHGGTVTIHVAGDLQATASNPQNFALGIDAGGIGGSNNILVEGTIVAKTSGVARTKDSGTLDVTVWKIESDCVASTYDAPAGSTTEDEALESAINYIIKVEQPKEGDLLRLSGTTVKTFTDAEKTSTFDVAHMGDKVYLDIADGWVITGAFSDEGKSVELNQDADGRWYVVVPNGGGVYLSAQVAEQFLVTFVNDDGTNLQSGMVIAGSMPEYKGNTPTKAPTDEYLYEFAGWKPILSPVTGKITYVATYNSIPRNGDSVDVWKDDSVGKTVAGPATLALATTPNTGDSCVAPAAVAVPALCLVLAGLFERRIRRN